VCVVLCVFFFRLIVVLFVVTIVVVIDCIHSEQCVLYCVFSFVCCVSFDVLLL
jgi:hypothetical protein